MNHFRSIVPVFNTFALMAWAATTPAQAADNQTSAEPAALEAPVPASSTPRAGLGGDPNLQIYRHANGQWQHFVGNGRWENVSPRNLPDWVKSPRRALEGNFEGAADLLPHFSGIAREESRGSTASDVAPMPAPPMAWSAQSDSPWSFEAQPDGAAPSAPGDFGSPQMHGFSHRSGRFARGWERGAEGSFERGNGGWMQSLGHAARSFGQGGGGWVQSPGHAASGAQAAALGGGHSWGGGGHMGGGSSHR
jgi:hypothetical protein